MFTFLLGLAVGVAGGFLWGVTQARNLNVADREHWLELGRRGARAADHDPRSPL